ISVPTNYPDQVRKALVAVSKEGSIILDYRIAARSQASQKSLLAAEPDKHRHQEDCHAIGQAPPHDVIDISPIGFVEVGEISPAEGRITRKIIRRIALKFFIRSYHPQDINAAHRSIR